MSFAKPATVSGSSRRRTVKNLAKNKWTLRVLLLAVIVGAWSYLTRPGGASPLLVPKMSRVWHELRKLVTTASTWEDIRVTLTEVLSAFAIATVASFVVVFWANRTQLRSRIVEPILGWAYMVPSVVFFPLFILWFGIGTTSKIAFGAYGCFFPMAFTALRGLRSVDPKYTRVGRAFGASRFQLEWMINFPASLPVLLAAVRVGAALTFIYVILAEMLAADRGIGALITNSSAFLDTPQSYALIVITLVLAALYYPLITKFARPRSSQPSRRRVRQQSEPEPASNERRADAWTARRS